MRKLEFLLVGSVCYVLGVSPTYATPSTTYWTPCTTDVQPFGKWHITYDSYFTVGRKGTEKGDFPTDVGLTVAVLPYEKLNMEVGFDLLEPKLGNVSTPDRSGISARSVKQVEERRRPPLVS